MSRRGIVRASGGEGRQERGEQMRDGASHRRGSERKPKSHTAFAGEQPEATSLGGEHQKKRQMRQENYLVRTRFGGSDALGQMRQFSLRQKRQSGPAASFSRVMCALVWARADP